MTVTMMKATFEKLQSKVVNYRDYKYFENWTNLLSELSKANIEENEEGLNYFLNKCKEVLDLPAPHKQKYARVNHILFMNMDLSKEIMTRTRLFFKQTMF